MIKLENITKQYNTELALKDVSFEASNNEIISIIGPSGGGKTTLLRCIAGIEEASHGSLYINGKKITRKNVKKHSKKIGMVFQNFNLFPHMNILENLTYAPQKVLKATKAESNKRAKLYLKNFGLSAKAKSMPGDLSGGQKQRIAIIRALMMDPEILLFDEPTSALDPEKVKDLLEIIKSLKKDMLVIVITHHLAVAKAISDRIIFMAEAQILCDQTADDFFKKPKSHRARLFLEKVENF